jgi:hypothetical protein
MLRSAPKMLAVRISLVSAVWAGLVLAACNGDHGSDPPDCEDQQPTFLLTVRAAEGALPADLHLTLRYGGSTTQEHILGQDAGVSEPVMFCTEVGGSAWHDAAPPAVTELRCELYTGQAAEITLESEVYGTLVETLILERNEDGCVITSEEELLLERGDAGS